jgi:hypothetical protein
MTHIESKHHLQGDQAQKVKPVKWQPPTYDDVKKANIRAVYTQEHQKYIAGIVGVDDPCEAQRFANAAASIAEMQIFLQLEDAKPKSSEVKAALEDVHNKLISLLETLDVLDAVSRREIEYQAAAEKESKRQGLHSRENLWLEDIVLEEKENAPGEAKASITYPGRPPGPGRKEQWSETPFNRMRTNGVDLLNSLITQIRELENLVRLAKLELPPPKKGRPRHDYTKKSVRSVLKLRDYFTGRRELAGHTGRIRTYHRQSMELVNAVLGPVLSEYWTHKSLERTVREVTSNERKRRKT